MNITLTHDGDVPLRQQLSEQIVFLITTGELRAGEEMPSVRALARRSKVHHNTVSKAYQELVRREWLTRKRGSRLVVGSPGSKNQRPDSGLEALGLDALINETIQRAKSLGYSLQTLRSRVRERLLAEPADHLLVVEDEPGLRQLIQLELKEAIQWRVECCSLADLVREPGLTIGAQVVAPGHLKMDSGLVPVHRPCFSMEYSNAEDQLGFVRGLQLPSNISVVSVSQSLLKTARSLLAPWIGRHHTYGELVLSPDQEVQEIDMRGSDLVFCDSIALPLVLCHRKFHYRLVSKDCVRELSMLLSPDLPVKGDGS